MNIEVNKDQLERIVIKWLNKHFGNLIPKTSSKYPSNVFYVNSDNEILIKYNQKNKYVWIHYTQIWSKIESLFHLNYNDTQSIMKVWMEETYKLEGITPYEKFGLGVKTLE
jgi:hypothetical protein